MFFITISIVSIEIYADEIRPGFLEVTEVDKNAFAVVWKIPAKGDKQLAIMPQFPQSCEGVKNLQTISLATATIQRWIQICPQGISNKLLVIDGLDLTQTDVLVRLVHLDGRTQTDRLYSGKAALLVLADPSVWTVIRTYLWLGVDHILSGLDHLLFVFTLLLIVVGIRQLLWTITAFTIAHSITLAGATLGWLSLPQQPVEAIIALSIVLLCVEVIHQQRGKIGVTARWPWLVAFIFGLLHGFGFAGALAEVGLPQTAIPLALIFFNLGVEFGQLIFVLSILALWVVVQRLFKNITMYFPDKISRIFFGYIIGSIAAFWTVDRVSGYWV